MVNNIHLRHFSQSAPYTEAVSRVVLSIFQILLRGGSRGAATWKPLTIITKRSILDVAVVLDPPLFLIQSVALAALVCPCNLQLLDYHRT